MNNLSADSEFRYIVQWFLEWSELQRDDFVPVLVDYLQAEQGGESASAEMNGMVNSVSIKPMSLFQCRIKLFRQWCPKWPSEFKQKLKEKIIEMDSKVGDKIVADLKLHDESGNVHLNGNGNGNENGNGNNEEENEDEVVESAAAEVSSIDDSRLAAVLHNETAVDDDNDAAQLVAVYDKPAEQVEMPENLAASVSSSAEVPSVA